MFQLPDARGFGNVSDLRVAMARDSQLMMLVKNYIEETDSSRKEALLDQLIYRWAGVQDDSTKQLYFVTEQQVALLEQLTASPFNHYRHGSKITKEPSRLLLKEYQQFRNYTQAQLLAQTTLYEYMKDIVLTSYNSGVRGIVISLKTVEKHYTELYEAQEI